MKAISFKKKIIKKIISFVKQKLSITLIVQNMS